MKIDLRLCFEKLYGKVLALIIILDASLFLGSRDLVYDTKIIYPEEKENNVNWFQMGIKRNFTDELFSMSRGICLHHKLKSRMIF